MATHDEDLIFSKQGLAEFIKLIRTDSESVQKIESGYSNVRASFKSTDTTLTIDEQVVTPSFSTTKDTDSGYKYPALKVYQKDNTWTVVLVGSDIEFYNEDGSSILASSGDFSDTPGTIEVAINGEKYDVPVIGITENFIPGSSADDDNQRGTILWTVKQSSDDSTAANLSANRVYGAVFNDYAEYREVLECEPGTCVIEKGDGSMVPSAYRLQPGGNIVSDTFGFAIGWTDRTNTPIAVCGRVLAKFDGDKNELNPGDAVCTGEKGTVSKMTREEIKEWPDRIVGYVSEVPTYDIWGSNNTAVNNRIWIKVK